MKRFVFFVIISLVFFSIGSIFIIRAFDTDYIQLFDLILGIFFFLPGLIILLPGIIKQFSKKINHPTEIQNVDTFQNKTNIKSDKVNKLDPFTAVLVSLLSIFALIAANYSYQKRDEVLNNSNAIELTVTLKEELEVKGKNHISNLITNEFPKFKFRFDSFYEKILNEAEFADQILAGDTLKIIIRESDYNIKIRKTVAPGIIDKYFEWELIDVFGLSTSKKVFYDLNDFEDYKISNRHFWKLLLGAGLFGILTMTFSFLRKF